MPSYGRWKKDLDDEDDDERTESELIDTTSPARRSGEDVPIEMIGWLLLAWSASSDEKLILFLVRYLSLFWDEAGGRDGVRFGS